MTLKKNIFKILITIFILFILIALFWSLRILNLKNHYPYFDKVKNSYEFSDKKPRNWTRLKHISPNLREAIIISEDWAFYEHQGIDFFQLKLVLEEALETGELSRGASTITAQLVKNTLLSSERSIIRKLLEFYYVFLVEIVLTKDEILEKYLNIIELGPNIYGVREGAKYYFKKIPKQFY
jgi:monofunctional biosynthetic peptidoglycan transglycosylase